MTNGTSSDLETYHPCNYHEQPTFQIAIATSPMPSFNHVGFNEIMVVTTPPLWSPTYQVGSDGLDNSWQWGQGSEHPRGQGQTFLTHFSSLTNSSAVTILWWKTLPTDFTVQISNCTKKVTFCICPSVCHLLSSFSHVSNQKRSPFPLHCNKCIALCTGNHDLKVSVGLFSMVTLFSLYQAVLVTAAPSL